MPRGGLRVRIVGMQSRLAVLGVVFTTFIACGGRDSASGGGPPGAGVDAGTDAGPYLAALRLPPGTRISRTGLEPPAGGCDAADECGVAGAGATCAALSGGYRVCVPEARVATEPSVNPTVDECDATRPCGVGACYAALRFPSGQCGLGGAGEQNICLADACQSDADCAGGICGPSGLTSNELHAGGGARECFRAGCRDDADCRLEAGGVCAFVASSCGRPLVGSGFRSAQLACVYPGGCVTDSDCGGASCSIVDGTAVCLAPQN